MDQERRNKLIDTNMDDIEKKIWKRIIKLQYIHGDLSDLILLCNDLKLTLEATINYLYRLEEKGFIDFVEWGQNNPKYFVLIPDMANNCFWVHKGVAVTGKRLSKEYKREYLSVSSQYLLSIIASSKPLNGENPKGIQPHLVEERKRIDKQLIEINKSN